MSRKRKPSETDIVQVNLRITRAEKRKLEAAARGYRSLNAEMVWRIESTFEQPVMLKADQLAENVNRLLLPLVCEAEKLVNAGDLIRATNELVDLVQPLVATGVISGPTGDAIRAAFDKISTAKRVIEIEAGKRLGKIGAQS
jgi:hypothetical protein